MIKKKMILVVTYLSLVTPVTSYGAVEPSCTDRELAHLQASVASSNLANIYTTHTPEGGAYKKKVVIRHRDGHCEIQSVEAFRVMHEPGHPDADREGFVKYPDISATEESRHLFQAREKIKKYRSSSKNSLTPQQSDIDVD